MSASGTLTKLFFDAVAEHGHKSAALRYKAGGQWHDISHAELERRVRHFALALRRLGVRRGDRVAILSENRPEWAVADFACLCIGTTDVPIYPTLPSGQIRYILNDAGAVVTRATVPHSPDGFLKLETTRQQLGVSA
ncbi:MAG: AMP-binding protein, partial [Gemmatimonadales bacterium]